MTSIHFKVMASEDHHFLSSSLYSSGTLVAWDPAPFSSDLIEVSMFIPSHLSAINGLAEHHWGRNPASGDIGPVIDCNVYATRN